MAETIVANKLLEDVIVGGDKSIVNDYIEILTINGTDIIGSDVVTRAGETTPDIDLLGSDQAVEGIVLGYAVESDKKTGYSLGVTIADNAQVRVLRRTAGSVKIQVILDRSGTTVPGSAEVEVGTPLYGSYTDAGKVTMNPDTTVAQQQQFLGYSAENVAAVSTDKLITMWY